MPPKKILYCASTASHIEGFHKPYLKALSDFGCEVYTAAEKEYLFDNTAGCFVLPFKKSFLSPDNLKAVFKARSLLLKERFDTVILNTTLAAAVMRLSILMMKPHLRPRVVYICHGFLFSQNSGFGGLKYLIPEKLLSGVTDVLAVMNDEDEHIARSHMLCRGKICRINGMGLPEGRFYIPDKEQRKNARSAFNIADDEFAFVCVAEFSKRKNQAALLRAFARTLPDMPRAKLIFAGDGRLFEQCKALAQKLGIYEHTVFLGGFGDIPLLLSACDAALSASISEGLCFAIMEQLVSGLPIAASAVKGHRELVKAGGSLELFEDEEQLCALMKKLFVQKISRRSCDMSRFMLSAVLPDIMRLYLSENGDEN